MGRLMTVVPSQWVDASGLFRVRFSCRLDQFVVRDAIHLSTAKGKEND